jgi:hypothetical protein
MVALQNLHVDSCLLIIISGPLLTIMKFLIVQHFVQLGSIPLEITDVENICITISIYLGVSLTVLKTIWPKFSELQYNQINSQVCSRCSCLNVSLVKYSWTWL